MSAEQGAGAGLAAVVVGAVRSRHAFEDCVERLATAIRLGVYPHGTALPPERELAVALGVSRATLREAIAGLRAAGMVTTTRGRGGGTVVLHEPATPGAGGRARLRGRRDELLDDLVFRRVVEPGAVQVAAGRTLSGSERALVVGSLAEVARASDPAEHRQADSRLHLALATVAGSPRLVEAVTAVQAGLHDMLVAIPVLRVNIEHSSAQHAAIVAAVLEGDGVRARREMERHCDDTAALLRGLLD
ncbi:transcriptional regulator, GntR family [Friedmanniella luteola]|uniref:Transcriptional regulator, GntR family n=1 Tax=Friedmanniella luteola TaxID=546871 RepID=A0A1H1XZ14_9ACTN|nr:GntR family transcriptional regulator [Friedmanniella luteola]SDT14474.1 transcriptional regulator, GntR family [Friedmanniella luteola]